MARPIPRARSVTREYVEAVSRAHATARRAKPGPAPATRSGRQQHASI